MGEILLPSSRKVKPLLSRIWYVPRPGYKPIHVLPWGPSISVESTNRHHNSYQDCVPHGCVRQCAGSFTHVARVTFATALRRCCFHSQVTVREKTHRAGGEGSRVRTSINAFVRFPRTEQQWYARPGEEDWRRGTLRTRFLLSRGWPS